MSMTMELLGGYNCDRRRDEVLNKLRGLMDGIHKEGLHRSTSQILASSAQKSPLCGRRISGTVTSKIDKRTVRQNQNDLTMMQLEGILSEVEELERNVKAFEGPHFTKTYRTLQGDCAKFQLDLDKLDVTGREDVREERRKVLKRIDELAKELASKTHHGGRSCNDGCEV